MQLLLFSLWCSIIVFTIKNPSKMKVEGKVIVKSAIVKDSKNNEQYIELLLTEPVFNQFTGEKVRELTYPAAHFPKVKGDTSICAYVGGKCSVKGYLNSFEKEKDGNVFYNIGLNITEITPI